MNTPHGYFLTLEGIEGSGKTSHARRIEAFLVQEGCQVLLTQEPGGTRAGEQIRRILLNPAHGELDPFTEVFLFQAARREHVKQVIQPALHAGKIVICVRFTDSTIAYQGYGRGVENEFLVHLNRVASGGLNPDCTIFLDVDPEEGLRRSMAKTSADEQRFEQEFQIKSDLLKRIREGFLHLAREEDNRFVVISSMRPREIVFEEIKETLRRKILSTRKGKLGWKA